MASKAGASEGEDVFGNFRSVRVSDRSTVLLLLLLLLMTLRRERGLHTDLAAAFTAFGGDIVGGGEGEEAAEGNERWRVRTEGTVVVGKREREEFDAVEEGGGFGKCHGWRRGFCMGLCPDGVLAT